MLLLWSCPIILGYLELFLSFKFLLHICMISNELQRISNIFNLLVPGWRWHSLFHKNSWSWQFYHKTFLWSQHFYFVVERTRMKVSSLLLDGYLRWHKCRNILFTSRILFTQSFMYLIILIYIHIVLWLIKYKVLESLISYVYAVYQTAVFIFTFFFCTLNFFSRSVKSNLLVISQLSPRI